MESFDISKYISQIDEIEEKLSSRNYQNFLKATMDKNKKEIKGFLNGLKKYKGHMESFDDLSKKEQNKIIGEVRMGISIGYMLTDKFESAVNSFSVIYKREPCTHEKGKYA